MPELAISDISSGAGQRVEGKGEKLVNSVLDLGDVEVMEGKSGILLSSLRAWPPRKCLDFRSSEILGYFTVLLQIKLSSYSWSFTKRLNMTVSL